VHAFILKMRYALFMQTYDGHDPEYDCAEISLLPPEALLAPNNPANDEYLRDVAALKRMIVSQTKCLQPTHVEICKKFHTGKKKIDIADEVGLTPVTVGRALKAPAAQKLLALLQHLALMMDGPRDGQRRNFLWRIAIRNEEKDPRVAISAIAEINKMTHLEKQLDLGIGDNVVQIVINNDLLPRGALD
jgi:hypothetical protein